MFLQTKNSSRVLAVFGAVLLFSTIAILTLDQPARMIAFFFTVIGWLGMLYGWGLNHYLNPSSHRPKNGLRESMIKDYWLIGKLFALASWVVMIMYYHMVVWGMREATKHDFFVLSYFPLPFWLYTLVPAAIFGTLWLGNIQGRRLVK